MPSLDNSTLAFAVFLVAYGLGAATLAAGLKHRPIPGARSWAAGTFTLGAGFLLLGLAKAPPAPLLGGLMAMLTTVGLVLIARGVYRFLGLPGRPWLHWGGLGLASVLFVTYLAAQPGHSSWGLGSLALAPLILADMARALLRTPNPRLRPIARFTALAFALIALASLFWGVYALAMRGQPHALSVSPFTSAIFSLDIMVLAAGSLGLLLMSSGRLEAELAARNDELEAEVAARRLAEEYLSQQAGQDYLTGLANRRKFFEEARKAVGPARRHGRDLALVMFDLDHFKRVNDELGHLAGDEALKALAAACRAQLRSEDTLARFGGEEFIALLPDTGAEEAVAIAERLRALAAATRLRVDGRVISLPSSFGVSVLHAGEPDIEAAVNRADQALYCAKQNGRNGTCLHPGPGAIPLPVPPQASPAGHGGPPA